MEGKQAPKLHLNESGASEKSGYFRDEDSGVTIDAPTVTFDNHPPPYGTFPET